MTLETLEGVLSQLNEQFKAVVQQVAPEKPVIQHCNAIEVLGAIQVVKQLIQQEQLVMQAPPGATGPVI